ncbi:MAG: YciI family protein [Alphaproteobacteria bacterium]|nr:YciI family protein [Alphaproteobacteria bacterium]
MQQFVITALDKTDGAAIRAANRTGHLQYLAAAADHGVKIILAGPLMNNHHAMIGSHLVLEAESEVVIKAFLAHDPYNMAGLFARVDIYPFKKVLPS